MAVATNQMHDEELHDACGLFGCIATGKWPTQLDVVHSIYLGLVGLQHSTEHLVLAVARQQWSLFRGQESAGIVTSSGMDSCKFRQRKGMGLVGNVFSEEDIVNIKGNLGIGHTRYSTQGDSALINIQPFVVETVHGLIAVAHNGELINASVLKNKLLRHGVGLSTGSDSELITQLLTHTPECGEPDGANWIGRIKKMMTETPTSYSLVIMHKNKIYAVRDPFGNRPLCIGKIIPSDFAGKKVDGDVAADGWVVSSESCSFTSIGARYHREVLAGEIIELSQDGIKSHCVVPRPEDKDPAFCIFEYVYFARTDSIIEGQMVYCVRQQCGIQLAKEEPVTVDLVSTVPESATPAALAYATELGIPYGEVFCKNRYVGRTFIQPSMRLRQLAVAKKFGPLTENFRGKRVVLVDDSIVRGNTMIPIVRLLKAEGAIEVHIRIASPPIKYPCYMGINIPTHEELIANKFLPDKLADYVGADSLKYLSVDGLKKAVQKNIPTDSGSYGHCVACLTGEYPVAPEW